MSKQIARLFKDAPDLHNDFRVFMPDRSQQLADDSQPRDKEMNRRKRKLDDVVTLVSNMSLDEELRQIK